ncbi:preprotein translocase subunit SecA [Lignipirellula cremea]|uniref:Protein translocase subunit SecA n=1 Tax=Lignipirellula cremea TaxID=2528010 RepID=A0A518DYD1_9BACT|nr:preprotein translocase subunit SecA [Lignipirellula cremea]QDU96853.1 preprotein translocase subunit SecA [Lignipirellula cremea]
MDFLERVWEAIGLFFSGLLGNFERGVTGVFGSSNARYIKKLSHKVEAINALEPKYQAMSDEELREQTFKMRERLSAGETLDDILVEAFAVCREAGVRYLGMRHYDVQLIGGMVLHSGAIAEMVTGEGKTLVATLPAYLNAISGKGVHVVTVNDYLARRDMEWMAPLYMNLGLTVGAIQSDMDMAERQKAYQFDITYGTNNEFGFDYLRDNMRPAARDDHRYERWQQQAQGPLNYAIIDEVDNILIDEARTPLIISGEAHNNPAKYVDADRIARALQKETHFVVNEKDHTATLTDAGVREAERLAGVESFYTAGNMEWPHLIDNALRAHNLYKSDVNYVVEDGKVVIIDEFTGRKMEGRQWSDGLHQAVEAKERVQIKKETQTLATITLQNFFKLYKKISGMTGTAMTEATEFMKIYELDVIAIPTHRKMQRIERPDAIYRTEKEKYEAVANEIERAVKWDVLVLKGGDEIWCEILKETDDEITYRPRESKTKETISPLKVSKIDRRGRPVLVGTVSIEKSERISNLLNRRGIQHEVLNAKYHKREAEIVAQAGRKGAVTIATNMAGRGTDIVLGGNPETMAWARLQDKYATRLDVPKEEWESLIDEIDKTEGMKVEGAEVKKLGGLQVIGTERHEARRIDLQLRGRCGRQGDPGSSQFYLSLEDDLMRIFAGEWVKRILDSLGMKEGEAIESKMVTRRVEGAQKKVEERHFEVRKNLLEYDEVMDEQRKRTYKYRQRILDGVDVRDLLTDMIEEQVEHQMSVFLERDYGIESFAKWAGARLSTQFESPRAFRGMDINSAEPYAKELAARTAESNIHAQIDENLPDIDVDEEDGYNAENDWNWNALAAFANAQWNLNLKERELKEAGRHGVAELLMEKSSEAFAKIDLSEGEPMLREDYGVRVALQWAHSKFGIELTREDVQGLEPAAFKALVLKKALHAYDEKEALWPVQVGLSNFSTAGAAGQSRIDRTALIEWANFRFHSSIDPEQHKNDQREELRKLLLEISRTNSDQGRKAAAVAEEKLAAVEESIGDSRPSQKSVQALADWMSSELGAPLDVEKAIKTPFEELERKVRIAVQDRFHPEMRRLEREVLLQIVDSAWKDHLLAMDYLKSAVGLRGWGQLDSKVEYKREGMRLFENVWNSIGEQTTDLIFRMEQFDEGQQRSQFRETKAIHAEAQSVTEIADEQQQAIENSGGGDDKIEPIRNRGKKVGRNDPCPCQSGKKYKNCCMRKQDVA